MTSEPDVLAAASFTHDGRWSWPFDFDTAVTLSNTPQSGVLKLLKLLMKTSSQRRREAFSLPLRASANCNLAGADARGVPTPAPEGGVH